MHAAFLTAVIAKLHVELSFLNCCEHGEFDVDLVQESLVDVSLLWFQLGA